MPTPVATLCQDQTVVEAAAIHQSQGEFRLVHAVGQNGAEQDRSCKCDYSSFDVVRSKYQLSLAILLSGCCLVFQFCHLLSHLCHILFHTGFQGLQGSQELHGGRLHFTHACLHSPHSCL